MRSLSKFFLLLAIVAVSLLMLSCGGGGGGSTSGGGTPPPPPAPVADPITITTAALPDAIQDTPYSAQFVATGGSGTLTYKLQSNTYPPWLSIDSTGKLTGTPAYSNHGENVVRVTVYDSGKLYTAAEYILNVNYKMELGNLQFGSASRGLAYSGNTFVISGTAPYTIESVTGLPPGLALSMSDRLITASGTPTVAGEYDLKFVVKDSGAPQQSLPVSTHISVDSRLRLVPHTFSSKQGQPIVGQLQIVNGVPPFTISAPNLSQIGLSVDSSGVLSGVLNLDPSGGGWTYGVSFTVTDSTNSTDTTWQNFYVARPFTPVPPQAPFVVHQGEYFSQYVTVSGGTWPLKYSLQFGQLPPGLHFNEANTTIDGTPTTPGSYSLGIHITDSSTPPETADVAYRIDVLGPTLVTSPGDLPKASLNHAYWAPMQVDKGMPPYRWTFDQGELPPGLTFSTDGTVTGTPTALGRYTFRAIVEDSATPANTVRSNYSIVVSEAPNRRNDTVPNASVGTYSLDATLSPFADPVDISNPDTDYYRYTAKSGSTITVSTSRDYNSSTDTVIEIVDSNGQRFHTCRNQEDDTAVAGIRVDTTPTANDDECLNDDSVIGYNSGSTLTFVPDVNTDFFVHVLDFSGTARPDLKYSLNVSGAQPRITISTYFDQARLGAYFSAALNAGGSSNPPYTFSIVPGSGVLPPGLSLSAPGSYSSYISGTPTAAGHYTFKVQAADSDTPASVGTLTMTIDVADLPAVHFGPLPDATTGQAYDAPYTTSGGIVETVYVYGTWPDGLTWSNGHISGTPLNDGIFSGTVYPSGLTTAGNAVPFTLVVHPGPIVVQGVPPAKTGQVYDGWLTAKGGHTTAWYGGSYTWTLLSGSLPPGITLSGGWLHGIPTKAGTYTFDVQVADTATPAQTATATITMIVQP